MVVFFQTGERMARMGRQKVHTRHLAERVSVTRRGIRSVRMVQQGRQLGESIQLVRASNGTLYWRNRHVSNWQTT